MKTRPPALAALVLVAIAAGGCQLNARQQTTLAGDALATGVDVFNDGYERRVISAREFLAAQPLIRGLYAGWQEMDAHADDVNALVIGSAWHKAYTTFTAEYAKFATLKAKAEKAKPAKVPTPAAVPTGPPVTPGAQPPASPPVTDDVVPPPPGG